jgi:predicted nucleic acid-binding protein
MPLTIANTGDRIYIDTNVLVYFFYTKQRPDFSEMAKEFLKKIEKSKFEGVITSITLMELIKCLRELLVKYGNIIDANKLDEIICQQLKVLYSIGNIRFVEGHPPEYAPETELEQLYYYTISNKSLKLMQNCKGRVYPDYNKGTAEHEGLHPMDIMHVVLAKQLHCDKIATFEWNFRETAKEVIPLILQDRDSVW